MKTFRSILLLLLTLVSTSHSGTDVQVSRPRVGTSDQENHKPMSDSKEVQVQGDYMKAFLIAYEAFRDDIEIPPQKRHIENYILRFSDDKNNYFVVFVAKRKPAERDLAGGESKLGKDVRYTVAKSDFRIVSRLFFK